MAEKKYRVSFEIAADADEADVIREEISDSLCLDDDEAATLKVEEIGDVASESASKAH